MEAVNVASLFAPLHQELIALLRPLSVDAWARRTVAGRWRVSDVAAHLLDGDLRKLAAHRDGHVYSLSQPPNTYGEVVSLINSLNASGVDYANRLSTRLLVELLEITGTWVSTFIEALDPWDTALYPVAWAGESKSLNWMDTGREYTERWHHQMQIREAVGSPLLLEDKWYAPLLSFSVRALPRTYESVRAAEGTSINLHILDSRWAWCLIRENRAWVLYEGSGTHPASTVRIARGDAWRLFYNAVKSDATESILRIEGDRGLAVHLAQARAVMM